MMTTGRSTESIGLLGWVCFVIATVSAVWLGSLSFSINLDHACETRQWPGIDVCLETPEVPVTSAASREWNRLRERVAANPGDGLTMSEMARYAGLPPDVLGLDGSQLLKEIAKVAPQRTIVLQQQALQALSARDWATAVPRLVQLSVRHGDQEASRALARLLLIAGQEAGLQRVLREAAHESAEWVDRALRAMVFEKLPIGPALPMVGEFAVLDALKPATGLMIVRQLKNEGRWLDAHAVWLQLWKQPVDLLYNGDFERDFVRNAFDWEFSVTDPARAGARVDRTGETERGKALRIQFTGLPIRPPLLKHDLFLPSGSYRFDSAYRTNALQSGKGLGWIMTCLEGGREIARSGAMETTKREWTPLEFVLNVPSDCQAITLTLSPLYSSEIRTGLSGELMLDRVRLTRTGSIGSGISR